MDQSDGMYNDAGQSQPGCSTRQQHPIDHSAKNDEKRKKRDWDCDPDWMNFLQNLPNDPNVEEDDENDPEFNLDLEENLEEDDDFRMAPTVGKQELCDLLAESLDFEVQSSSRMGHQRRYDLLSTPVPYYYLDQTEPVASTSADGSVENWRFEQQTTPHCDPVEDPTSMVRESGDLLIGGVVPLLSEFERLQLAEQLRKHVQLLVQTVVITKEVKADGATQILETVETCLSQLNQHAANSSPSSIFHIWNLPSAFATLDRFHQIESQPKVPLLSGKKDAISVGTAQLMATSPTFLYPSCLPDNFIPAKRRLPHKDKHMPYAAAEIELLALSYSQFRHATTSERELCRLVQEYCMPHRSLESLRHQIARLLAPTSGMNPVKMAAKGRISKEIPRSVQLFDPSCVLTPLEQVSEESPEWLKQLNSMQSSRDVTSRCSTPRKHSSGSDIVAEKMIRPQSCPVIITAGFSGVLRSHVGESVFVQITSDDIKVSPLDSNSLVSTPTVTSSMWATVPTSKIAIARVPIVERGVTPKLRQSSLISSTPSTSTTNSVADESEVEKVLKKKRPYKPRPRKPQNPWSKRRKTSSDRSVTDSYSTDVSSVADAQEAEDISASFSEFLMEDHRADGLLEDREFDNNESLIFNNNINELSSPHEETVVASTSHEESMVLGFSLNCSNSAITTTPVKRKHSPLGHLNFSNSSLRTPPKWHDSPIKATHFGSGFKHTNPFSPKKSPLKWKQILRLSAQKSPKKHFAPADNVSPIPVDSPPYSPNNLKTPPTKSFIEIQRETEGDDVFKRPKHHTRVPAKPKRTKVQLVNESLAALQQEVDAEQTGSIMATTFSGELSKAFYMHKGKLETFLQTVAESNGERKLEVVVQLIRLLSDETVASPSTYVLCEMLTYFLNAEEAETLGCYDKFLQFHDAHKALWRMSRFISVRKGSHASRVIKNLKTWLDSTKSVNPEKLKEKLGDLIGTDITVRSELLKLFPDEPVPLQNSASVGQFEVIKESDVLGSPEKPSLVRYERISLPLTKPQGYANVGTKVCSCECHATPTNAAMVHCSMCSVKFAAGAIHALSKGEFCYANVSWAEHDENRIGSPLYDKLQSQNDIDMDSMTIPTNFQCVEETKSAGYLEGHADVNTCGSTQDILKKAVRMCFLDLNSQQSPLKKPSESTSDQPADNSIIFIRGPQGMDMMFPLAVGPNGEVLQSHDNSLMEVTSSATSQQQSICGGMSSTLDSFSVAFPPNLYETSSQTGDICGATEQPERQSLLDDSSSGSQTVLNQPLRQPTGFSYDDDFDIVVKLGQNMEVADIVKSIVERTNKEPLEVEKHVRFLYELRNEES